ncbi:dapper homolog 1 [Spinachia spinachia]
MPVTDMDPGRRAADADAAGRQRQRQKRERLDATASALAELEYVRQRQEELVRAALELREEKQEELRLSSEEKLLHENILLLRKQLNCLRGRDAGLVSQLQELDQQISDLRLDSEVSYQLETESRSSSGFYDLSDEASVSLSNSSNSVFSECFSSFTGADGGLLSADQPAGCQECDGSVAGFRDESSWSGRVRHPLSAPHPALHLASLLDPVLLQDSQSKYLCELVTPNGSNVSYYPSPLHAVVVQSPVLLQMLGYGGVGATIKKVRPEPSPYCASGAAPLISQSYSWPASSQAQSYKRLDGYIYGLLQRRALPVKSSRPRTSVSADSSKSTLRHDSFCMTQVSCSDFVTLRGSEFRGGALARAISSPQRSGASKCEEQVFPDGSVAFKMSNSDSDKNQNIQKGSTKDFDPESGVLRQTRRPPPSPSPVSTASLLQELREPDIPKATSSTIDIKQPCGLADLALLLKISPKLPKALRTKKADGPGSSSTSLNRRSCAEIAQSVAAHQQTIKSCRCRKKVKVRTAVTQRTGQGLETNERDEGRGHQTHRRFGSRKSRLPDARGSRFRHIPLSTPEDRVLGKHATLGTSRLCRHGNHLHHHRCDQVAVVPNPKHNRNNYRRLYAIAAVSDNEASRCAQRHQREELCLLAGQSGPYPQSDSEYSAECGSLFHSTIVDTSKDVACKCNTNCFRDRDSGKPKHGEESGGGGMRGVTGGAGRGVTPAQAKVFIKIKASHNLKKKILRFRSGSLKLMTTI